ncbi:hypothetical protein B0H17DRAFT_958657 [Mycena rosella]|uniref:Uncharacterized protein n=1 Tax=Mycena rosella TaxID=1033263 RepID=A0AAD7CHC2_MYCRO|nr:hypothetical protein B0H17DRAFT_958657 [Mycena rosella]
MEPGSRHDTLDDHWSHWNWQKLVGLGMLLKKRLLNAIPERNYQKEAFQTFTEHQLENVPAWKAMVKAFECDATQPNPYELPKSGLTEHDVRRQFANEEAAEEQKGILHIHNVSPSAFILAGLDLEEQQRRIKVTVQMHKNDTSKSSADITKKRTKLSRYTACFCKIQAIYMPGACVAGAR